MTPGAFYFCLDCSRQLGDLQLPNENDQLTNNEVWSPEISSKQNLILDLVTHLGLVANPSWIDKAKDRPPDKIILRIKIGLTRVYFVRSPHKNSTTSLSQSPTLNFSPSPIPTPT